MAIKRKLLYVSVVVEMAHQDIGLDLLERVKTIWLTFLWWNLPGKLEGREAVMVLAPKKK